MKMLKFNSTACFEALKTEIKIAIVKLQKIFLEEAKSGMRTPEGAESLELWNIEELTNYFSAQIIGGAYAVMDNYGTGSKMSLEENPALDDYKNSELWNPARKGDGIVGRPKGSYTNIFGETQYSSGRKEGELLEIKYPPSPPSFAIETALRWIVADGTLQKEINNIVRNFDMSRFISTH